MSQPLKHALLISLMVAATAGLSYLATISHGVSTSSRPAIVAALVTLFGTLPPLMFASWFSNGAANQLAVIAWRFAIMLPALAIAFRYVDGERKCYLIALLACYFVALPLESWLLIRDVRRKQANSS